MRFSWHLILITSLTICAGVEAVSLQERIQRAGDAERIEIRGGVHQGNIVIDRPVTLIGLNGARIQGDGTGHVLEIRGAYVTVQGFHIAGSGLNLVKDHAGIHITGDHATIRENRITDSLHGIYVKGASHGRIKGNIIEGVDEKTVLKQSGEAATFGAGEFCRSDLRQDRRGNGIHFWNSNGNVVFGNEIFNTRDGIYFSFTDNTRIENNRIHHARYGLHYMYSHHNVFSNNQFFKNAAGAAIMYSKELVIRHNQFVQNQGQRAYGIVLQSVDRSLVENNLVQGNTTGIYFQNSYGNVTRQNQITRNYIGLRLTSSSMDNSFSLNEVGPNLHNIDLAGRSVGNKWDEDGRGNYWKNSTPLDLDADGISEIPHREVDLFGSTRREFPYIAFLSGSPGMKALQFALQRAPLPKTPVITDSQPLTSSPIQKRNLSGALAPGDVNREQAIGRSWNEPRLETFSSSLSR